MPDLATLHRCATIGLFAIVALAALEIAENVFAPFVLAVVVGVVLGPLADRAARSGIPPAATAILTLLLFFTVLAGLAILLAGPVAQLIDQAPRIIRRVGSFLGSVRSSLDTLESLRDGVSSLVPGGGDAALAVESEDNTLTEAIAFAPGVISTALVFVGSLFFFILSRDAIYVAIARLARERQDEIRLLQTLHETELAVSRYFLTITMINAGLGFAVFGMAIAFGLASPALWGLLAFGLNYILFLGPICMIAMLTITGMTSLDGLTVFGPAATFVLFNMMESQFITPTLVGRSLTLNPLLVFVSLVFGIWLWGPIGGFVAIPILLIATAFVMLRHNNPLPAPAAEELGERP